MCYAVNSAGFVWSVLEVPSTLQIRHTIRGPYPICQEKDVFVK
jgi:hypothetical protein